MVKLISAFLDLYLHLTYRRIEIYPSQQLVGGLPPSIRTGPGAFLSSDIMLAVPSDSRQREHSGLDSYDG